MRILVLILVAILQVGTAFASGYELDGLIINIPQGFEGPTVGNLEGAKVSAFVKRYPDQAEGTLLQISAYDFGNALVGMPEEAREEGTRHYLRQFLGGIERKRQQFVVEAAEVGTLGGILSARAEWSGIAGNRAMTGVMYCVIVGTRVFVFHTQDIVGAPDGNRSSALKSIESVTFRAEG